jgi:hypothetical protein
MTTLMGDDCFQRKVVWVSVALERLGINDKQIALAGGTETELRATAAAVNMAVLNLPNITESTCDAADAMKSRSPLRRRDRLRPYTAHYTFPQDRKIPAPQILL